jgi:hypothetical protein
MAGNGENVEFKVWYRDWKVMFTVTLLMLHLSLFSISAIVFTLAPTNSTTFPLWGYMISFSYVSFKLFISGYFFWGHWNVYRVFRKASHASGSTSSSNHSIVIGRRLAAISAVNLLCLFVMMVFSAMQYGHHGWILMEWAGILQTITSLLEVQAVPISADGKVRAMSFQMFKQTLSSKVQIKSQSSSV